MKRVFIVARDLQSAARDASNLGLRPGFWTLLHDPRQLVGRRGFAVLLGSGHGEHPAWPEIAAEVSMHNTMLGDEVTVVDLTAAAAGPLAAVRVRRAALASLGELPYRGPRDSGSPSRSAVAAPEQRS